MTDASAKPIISATITVITDHIRESGFFFQLIIMLVSFGRFFLLIFFEFSSFILLNYPATRSLPADGAKLA